MSDTDFLFTVAEVAVTLAGFAGLVSVIAQRPAGRFADLAAHRLRTMLLYSLTATVFSLIPYLFLRAGLGDELSWRMCSAGFFAAWLPMFVRARAHSSRFTSDIPLREQLLLYVGIAISVGGLAVLALNVAGVFRSQAAVAYQSSLLLLLLAALRVFVRLFVSLIRPAV